MARTLPQPAVAEATAPAREQARRRRAALLGAVTGYAAMVAVALLIFVPLLWMLTSSLKTRQEIYTVPTQWIPETVKWDNYSRAWISIPFGRFYVNSLVVTLSASALKMVNGVLTAYALVFLRFPRRNVIFVVVLAALMVPEQVTLIPNFLFVSDLGWEDTYLGLIVPGAGVAFGTFLMRQHFRTLPREVIEAARIDGAGHLKLLWHVVLPMSRPALVTFGLLTVVAKWNEYLWPLLITHSTSMRTLPVGLTLLQDSEGSSEWGVVMAGAVLVVAPVIVLFLWAQRHVIEGLTAGSVKG